MIMANKIIVSAMIALMLLAINSGCHERTLQRMKSSQQRPECLATLSDLGITMPEGGEFDHYFDYGLGGSNKEWSHDFTASFEYDGSVDYLSGVFIESLRAGGYEVYRSTEPPYTFPSAKVAGYKEDVFVIVDIADQAVEIDVSVIVNLYRERGEKTYKGLIDSFTPV